MEKDELGVEKYLKGRVDLVLADHPYNARRDQKDDHAKYDLLDSHDFNDMAVYLEEDVNPGAHGTSSAQLYNFRSVKQLLLSSKSECKLAPRTILARARLRARRTKR